MEMPPLKQVCRSLSSFESSFQGSSPGTQRTGDSCLQCKSREAGASGAACSEAGASEQGHQACVSSALPLT